MRVAVIGGGAAGFFAAIHVGINYPNASVVLFEKTGKTLAKVRISGGGRCNVTNACTDISSLLTAYPRGASVLKKAFKIFNTAHTIEWFEQRGVKLKAEADGRIFPVTDNAQTIIDCLLGEAQKNKIKIRARTHVARLLPHQQGISLEMEDGAKEDFDKVIVTTGGSPKSAGLAWLASLGHEIVKPVPSLFTFNIPDPVLHKLQGSSTTRSIVKIAGTKHQSEGPILVTHWGLSGPPVLRLSAYAARDLYEKNYEFEVLINWIAIQKYDEARLMLKQIIDENPKKRVANVRLNSLTERMWHYLLTKAAIDPERTCENIGSNAINKLTTILTNDSYPVKGKTTFKEEFVTCGGVSLSNIHPDSMKSKKGDHLYFAGEVLDIDGITGGFNFQAAWTTAFIAARLG